MVNREASNSTRYTHIADPRTRSRFDDIERDVGNVLGRSPYDAEDVDLDYIKVVNGPSRYRHEHRPVRTMYDDYFPSLSREN